MRVTIQTNGVVYTQSRISILFRTDDLDPMLVFGDDLVRIDDPVRFGYWHNPEARTAYLRNFIAGKQV